jgi:hypothetical protein
LVLLGRHPCSHTVCAGSHATHLPTGVTYLLRWRAFVELAARGYTWNDLTNGSRNPVTKFKEQLGGSLQMNMVLRLRRGASYRIAERSAQRYQRMRARAAKLLDGRFR